MALEGEEVAQRARPQRGEQPRVRDRRAGRGDRRAGLDERDHVAVEAGVDDGVAVEDADARALPAVVGHELHGRSSCISAAARRIASVIFT